MKGIVKWIILSFLAMTLFLILSQVCQGEDTIPIQGHTQTPGPKDSSLLLAGKQDHGENPLAQNDPVVVAQKKHQGESADSILSHVTTPLEARQDVDGFWQIGLTPRYTKYEYGLAVESLGKAQSEESKQESHRTQYEYAFSYGLFVHHYESEKANEGIENRMLAFEHKNIVVSYFDNSYNKDTVFLGYAFHTDKIRNQSFKDWWVRGNFYLGGLVGYGDKNPCNFNGLGLGAYPTGSLGYKQTSIEMGVMPTFVWWALKYEF